MKKQTFAEKQIETLYAHMSKCPLCQKKNQNASNKIKIEHELWIQKLSMSMCDCKRCNEKKAKKTEDLCEIVQIFIDQDQRTIKGTKNFSKSQYNISRSGEKKRKQKAYVKSFDPLILSESRYPQTSEEAEILSAYDESSHGFDIYDIEAPIPDGLPEELRTICKAVLLGFTQQEIADQFGISKPAINKKIKKISNMVNKKPIQLPLYSERERNEQ